MSTGIAWGLTILSLFLLPGISLYIISPPMPKLPVSEQKVINELSAPVEDQAVSSDTEEFLESLGIDIDLPYEDCRASRRTHVLDKYALQLNGHVTHALKNVVYTPDTFSRVAGVIVKANVTQTRSGQILTGFLNDPSGTAEFVLFADKYAIYPAKQGDIIYAVGKISGSKLIINNLDFLGKRRVRSKQRIEGCEAM